MCLWIEKRWNVRGKNTFIVVIDRVLNVRSKNCILDGYDREDVPKVADKLYDYWYRIFINYKTYLTIILKDYPSFMTAIWVSLYRRYISRQSIQHCMFLQSYCQIGTGILCLAMIYLVMNECFNWGFYVTHFSQNWLISFFWYFAGS